MSNDIQQIINHSLTKATDYSTYREQVAELVTQGKNTGPEQTEALAEYTKLNDRRMKRLDKTLKISEADENELKAQANRRTFLVLTESWCGDAAQTMPVINKVADLNPNFEMKVVLRDENLDLMDAFLSNGARAIPKMIVLDEDQNVIGEWGSRPSTATKMVEDYKAAHGGLSPEFKQELQLWYNKDKGQTTVTDLKSLIVG
ncbi:thioredoxin family protein [Sediminicola luteus]|uniref:Thioredoxin family protein n=2 Tax=Sediminicola luteus TaxID=319238 RepID=A0A2A4G565_9FLAO|nr:thioredoxin family protein [Sediminicola luteus]